MVAEIVYDGELSGTAYLILSVTVLVLIGGLSWCFYRAVKARGAAEATEQQLPDDGQPPPQ